MKRTLLTNARIVTGEYSKIGALGIEGPDIFGIWPRPDGVDNDNLAVKEFPGAEIIDLSGKILMAGGIDAHVHFREPGITRKADMESESKAALLGGITSFIDMPNTNPPSTSIEAVMSKIRMAEGRSWCNYGFHIGATNTNAGTIKEYIAGTSGNYFRGIKVFMGSSTGNMLVDREETLREIFRIKDRTILVHCEDEATVKNNLEKAKKAFCEYDESGNILKDNIPFSEHPAIRSREACIKSTKKALELAMEYGTRLHILHVSTEEEAKMIQVAKRFNPQITAETSANYLWFDDSSYSRLEGLVKCNPAIKTARDRDFLRKSLASGTIDTIGSDHAPHLHEEKNRSYLSCPSGVPGIEYSLPAVFTIAGECGIPFTTIAKAYSENISRILGIEKRGFIKTGYRADLTVIDPEEAFTVKGTSCKCGWSPYEGCRMKGCVKMVFINGQLAVRNGSMVADRAPGELL